MALAGLRLELDHGSSRRHLDKRRLPFDSHLDMRVSLSVSLSVSGCAGTQYCEPLSLCSSAALLHFPSFLYWTASLIRVLPARAPSMRAICIRHPGSQTDMGMLGGAAGSACAGKRLRTARGEPKLGLRAVPDVVPAAPTAERSAARERERERVQNSTIQSRQSEQPR